MTNAHDALDTLIRSALNEPLGEGTLAGWEKVFSRPPSSDGVVGTWSLLKRRRSLRWTSPAWLVRGAAIAAAGLIVAVVFLVIPSKHPDLLANAAAAIQGSGPVVHLVYAPVLLPALSINVKTGTIEKRLVPTRDELWYDPQRHLYKEIRSYPGGSDTVWRSKSEAFSAEFGRQALSGSAIGQAVSIQVPPEATLFSHYKQALTQRQAQNDGTGTAWGHPVFFLLIDNCVLIPYPGHPGSSLGCGGASVKEVIAIDQKTYQPVSVYPNTENTSGNGFRIDSVTLVARSQADLSKPARTPFPPALSPSQDNCPCAQVGTGSSRTIQAKVTGRWLGRPAVGLAVSLASRRFSIARADVLNPPGTPTRHGVELIYGATCSGMPKYGGDYVLVQEAPTPETFYGTETSVYSAVQAANTVPLVRTYSGFAECDAAKIGYYAGQDRAEQIWVATLHTHGLYVSVSSRSEALTVAATRQLLGKK